eukprot:jgi/Botrbrau1/21018/Bobra.0144s0031.1
MCLCCATSSCHVFVHASPCTLWRRLFRTWGPQMTMTHDTDTSLRLDTALTLFLILPIALQVGFSGPQWVATPHCKALRPCFDVDSIIKEARLIPSLRD